MKQNIEQRDINSLSFEEALQELEKIVKNIEEGRGTLESFVQEFERGALLKKHCDTKLQEAKLKIEQITKIQEGEIKAEHVDL